MRSFLFTVFLLLVLAGCGAAQVGGPLPTLPTQELDMLPPQAVPNVMELLTVNGATNISEEIYIRVLIGTSGFTSRVHERLDITATGAFAVWGGGAHEESFCADRTMFFEAGEVFSIHDASIFNGYERILIQPHDSFEQLQIVGLRRNWPNDATPLYRGRLEITAVSGGFIVINELPLEEYLYAVVPSEIPSAWGFEASKVQAITARSFAYRQMYENRFRAYGAHVDDSVISQVYNNLPETETARDAVRATRGLVLAYNGQVIVANYFSASGGTTANAGEVWTQGSAFPGESPPFLRAGAQFEPGFVPGDLRLCANADAFFRMREVPGFEQEVNWFRWQVRMTAAELTTAINAALPTRARANAALIQGATDIGTLTDLRVVSRGQGGNIMEMELVGTRGTTLVLTEFNIRSVLAPRNTPVHLNDGSILNGWAMMPSAFFSIEIEHDALGALTAVAFYGGGHGHGVGMSQHGARQLLARGYTYRQVLAHFYPNTDIISLRR
ncbi:MAG: SpoIID/LytB domain-containing protein [Defluviitaleaceae bacterium]|nr:SpoIID/LytB domain-containing protein [Defluviitaleaceae bacterium]